MSKFERPVWPEGHPYAGRPYSINDEPNPARINHELQIQELEWAGYQNASFLGKIARRLFGSCSVQVGFHFREPAKTEITRE